MNDLIPPFDWTRVFVEQWTGAANIDASFWVVATGALAAVSCGIVGCFLILRGMAMIGDAVSHAVLPGIAGAFLLSGSRASFPMFLGAAVVGVLTAALIEAVYKSSRIKADASIGVVFPALFALGVLLISLMGDKVDLDQECVLYGEIAFVPFEARAEWFGWTAGPESTMVLLCAALVVIGGVVLFYRPLLISSFDPQLATSMGVSAAVVHYGLMTVLSLTVVCSFEAVGAILVISMLIAPGATAYLFTDRLPTMLWISAGHGIFCAFAGWHLSVWLDCSTAGAMAVVGAGLFFTALVVSPRHGLLARLGRRVQLARRVAEENALGTLYRSQEEGGGPIASASLAERLGASEGGAKRVFRRLRRRGWAVQDGAGTLALTEAGTGRAAQLLRAHRLWETLLSNEVGLPDDHLHSAAHLLEHYIDKETLEALSDTLGHPSVDPHGRPIPKVD